MSAEANRENNGESSPGMVARPDLKRTLKDLLVQDEVSDSDIEMLEKNSQNEKQEGEEEETLDPDMCVECGDQVPYSLPYDD